MMKRIPKGTLKVTTSELDGCEAHEKSKRAPFQKRGHVNVKTPKSIRSRVTDGSSAISPASPTPSLGSHHHHSFQFLRRPFGGAASYQPRKSSSAAKTLHQTDTCGSSDTGSSSSGVLGIAAPPCLLTEGTIKDSIAHLMQPKFDHMTTDGLLLADGGNSSGLRSPSSSHVSQVNSSTSSSEDILSPPPTPDPPTPEAPHGLLRRHQHILGIHRACYELPALDSDRINLSEEDITKICEDQESEIVFECGPDLRGFKHEKYTLFEQSWLTDSDEDIRREREQLSPARRQGGSAPTHVRLVASKNGSDHLFKDVSASPAHALFQAPAKTQCQPGLEGPSRTRTTRLDTKPEPKSLASRNSVTIKSSVAFAGGSRATGANAAQCVKIFVLLLQADNKIFELIQLTYPVEGTTLGSLLEMIPGNATEPVLASQCYVGITRPRKRSPDFCDLTLMASDLPTGANYHSVGLQQGEVVVALPEGFSHGELVRLAKKILSNARIQGLLERSSAKFKKSHMGSVSQSAVEAQVNKGKNDFEEGMKRGFAVASVANAAVRNDPTRGSDGIRSTSADLMPSPKTFHDGATSVSSAYVSRTSLSGRQQRATRGITMMSGMSSVSSSSTMSSVNRHRRSLASIAKMRNQNPLRSSLGLSSACSMSSSGSGISGLGKVVEKREDSPPVKKVLDTRPAKHINLRVDARDNSQPGECTHGDLEVATALLSSPKAAARQYQPFLEPLSKPNEPPGGSPAAVPLKSPSAGSLASLRSIGARASPTLIWRFRASTSNSLTSDAASVDRSVISQIARKHPPRRDSFASFTQRSKGSFISHGKRQRQRAAFVSSLTWGLALLCMTMILRFYTDPQGYHAVAPHRNCNQPLGLLGGFQLFLMLHMLIKFQQAFLSGAPTSAVTEAASRVPSVETTPLLCRRRSSTTPRLR